MKKIKDVIKFINQTRKKNNYHWNKEGEELIFKINNNKYEKSELKNILSILLLTEEIPNDFISKLWLSSTKIKENINNNKDQYIKLLKGYDILIKNKHPFYLYLDKISETTPSSWAIHPHTPAITSGLSSLRCLILPIIPNTLL